MSKSYFFSVILAALIITFPSISHADVIFDEGTAGDVTISPDDPQILALPLGPSTVLGVFNSFIEQDYDSYLVTPPLGSSLKSFTISYDASPEVEDAWFEIGGYSHTADGIPHWFIILGNGDETEILPSDLNLLGSGPFSLRACGPPTPGDFFVWANYRFDFDVAPVPVPSSMLLFGTGLAGFGVFRRKFRKE